MLQGYARISSADDDLAAQEAALRAGGCTKILVEDGTGTVGDQRARLAALLDGLNRGDKLVVTRMDRIARSIGDLRDLVENLTTKGVVLKTTAQPIDTAAAPGPTFRDLLGAFAEFEANLRRERQRDGIAKAKAEGVYKGRKRSVERDKVQELLASGVGPTEIAAQLGISRTSVYRATTVPLLPGPKAGRKVQ